MVDSNKNKGLFITGTSTDVGKTTVALSLIKFLGQKNFKTAILKPISTGCYMTKMGLRCPDTEKLQKETTLQLPYEVINPFCFMEPIAPHIAAAKMGLSLTVNNVFSQCQPFLLSSADYKIIEGTGGFKVPLNHDETFGCLAAKFNFPILLVVHLELGCLNHAILSCEAILNTSLTLRGFVVTSFTKAKMPYEKENIQALRAIIKAPYLGKYPQCRWEELL